MAARGDLLRRELRGDLRRYLDACDPPVTAAAVSGRVDGLCAKVKQALLAAAESGGGGAGRAAAEADADEQIGLGCRLYYKMLDRFLSAEEQRLRRTNFSPLLASGTFHTALLACCLESVFHTYSTSGMAFPALLTTLDLEPFDFGKVIESFIKHEDALPTHLRKHFEDVDAHIVEALAWRDGSPLHALMTEYDAELATRAAAASSAAAGAAPPPAAPAAEARAMAALERFVRKCLYLAAKRLQDMCLRLLLPNALVKQVWEVVKVVIDKAEVRHLLVGRHLDQILMCSIYGACKVNQKELEGQGHRPVTFRHIIEQYKRQHGSDARTFRSVRMRTADEPPLDIIQFYNAVFIPTMKDHLLGVCTPPAAAGGGGAAGVSAVASAGAASMPADGAAAAGGGSNHISPDINASRGVAGSPRHVSAGGTRDLYISQRSAHAPTTGRPT